MPPPQRPWDQASFAKTRSDQNRNRMPRAQRAGRSSKRQLDARHTDSGGGVSGAPYSPSPMARSQRGSGGVGATHAGLLQGRFTASEAEAPGFAAARTNTGESSVVGSSDGHVVGGGGGGSGAGGGGGGLGSRFGLPSRRGRAKPVSRRFGSGDFTGSGGHQGQ